jgi:hypothetical protein
MKKSEYHSTANIYLAGVTTYDLNLCDNDAINYAFLIKYNTSCMLILIKLIGKAFSKYYVGVAKFSIVISMLQDVQNVI